MVVTMTRRTTKSNKIYFGNICNAYIAECGKAPNPYEIPESSLTRAKHRMLKRLSRYMVRAVLG